MRRNYVWFRSMSQRWVLSLVAVFLLGIVGLVVWGLVSVPPSATLPTDDSGDPNASIVYYYGRECPHCKDLEKFLEENKIAEKLPFAKKEVWHNAKNSSEMRERANACGLREESLGVPFIWADGSCFVGGPDAEKFFREKAGI